MTVKLNEELSAFLVFSHVFADSGSGRSGIIGTVRGTRYQVEDTKYTIPGTGFVVCHTLRGGNLVGPFLTWILDRYLGAGTDEGGGRYLHG